MKHGTRWEWNLKLDCLVLVAVLVMIQAPRVLFAVALVYCVFSPWHWYWRDPT